MYPAFLWHIKSRKHPTKAAIFNFTCFFKISVLRYHKKARYLFMLNKHSVDILKYISSFDRTEIASIYSVFGKNDRTNNSIATLKQEKYIQGHTYNSIPCFSEIGGKTTLKTTTSSPYSITSKGLAYLEEQTSNRIKFNFDMIHKWTNTAIAAVALAISLLAYINR